MSSDVLNALLMVAGIALFWLLCAWAGVSVGVR